MSLAGSSGGGGRSESSDAMDALHWKSMYERMRDLRETEAERVSDG